MSPVSIRDLSQDLRRHATLFATALLAMGAAEIGLFAAGRSTRASVDRSREVADLAQRAAELSVDRETSVRGFLVTRDSASLQREKLAHAALGPALDSLLKLVADNPRQQSRVRSIAGAIADVRKF